VLNLTRLNRFRGGCRDSTGDPAGGRHHQGRRGRHQGAGDGNLRRKLTIHATSSRRKRVGRSRPPAGPAAVIEVPPPIRPKTKRAKNQPSRSSPSRSRRRRTRRRRAPKAQKKAKAKAEQSGKAETSSRGDNAEQVEDRERRETRKRRERRKGQATRASGSEDSPNPIG